MIAVWPGVTEPGSITDRVGHLIDFMPTMLEFAQAPPVDGLLGNALQPALSGASTSRSWPLFWQFNRAKAMRDHNWKLVRYGNSDWELYDLDADPTECVNLAASQSDKVNDMAAQWQQWWQNK